VTVGFRGAVGTESQKGGGRGTSERATETSNVLGSKEKRVRHFNKKKKTKKGVTGEEWTVLGQVSPRETNGFAALEGALNFCFVLHGVPFIAKGYLSSDVSRGCTQLGGTEGHLPRNGR